MNTLKDLQLAKLLARLVYAIQPALSPSWPGLCRQVPSHCPRLTGRASCPLASSLVWNSYNTTHNLQRPRLFDRSFSTSGGQGFFNFLCLVLCNVRLHDGRGALHKLLGLHQIHALDQRLDGLNDGNLFGSVKFLEFDGEWGLDGGGCATFLLLLLLKKVNITYTIKKIKKNVFIWPCWFTE